MYLFVCNFVTYSKLDINIFPELNVPGILSSTRSSGSAQFKHNQVRPALKFRNADERVWHVKRRISSYLGAIWIADALLQIQPVMFTEDLVSSVIQTNKALLPSVLTPYFESAARYISQDPQAWNVIFAILQFLIGSLLLSSSHLPVKLCLCISIPWSLAVWFEGEGLGGIFAGGLSVLSGFPGAALLYVVVSVMLLLPDHFWLSTDRFSPVRDAPSVFWFPAAIQQSLPSFWAPVADSAQIINNASYPPPMAYAVSDVALVFAHFGWIANAFLVAAMLSISFGTYGEHSVIYAYYPLFALTLFIWIFVEGIGGIFTGIATDLNTGPLILLLSLPSFSHARNRRRTLLSGCITSHAG